MRNGLSSFAVLCCVLSCLLWGIAAWAQPEPQGGPPENPLTAWSEGGYVEKWNSGWALYIDNDRLLGQRDQDYTGGGALSLSGRRAREYVFSIDPWLNWLDRSIGVTGLYADQAHFQTHAIEFGATLFTPRDLETSEPIFDDRPYASLVFMANSEQTILPSQGLSYTTMLTVGLLGLRLPGEIQAFFHDLVGAEPVNGWRNQISDGGEPTAKYSVSVQKTLLRKDPMKSLGHDLKLTGEGNIGYLTDLRTGLSWRWGRIRSPWWTFNVHQAEYITTGSPVARPTNPMISRELYLWAGAMLSYRLYNVFLQGQFRDSVVTFDSEELEPLVGEIWLGGTLELRNCYRASLFVRQRSKELKVGDSLAPIWGGLIITRSF